ncbi:type I-D CRISPR-associated protein Cas10d/Csc3 [Natrarchaeobius halalkaliphilus]|uniref:Type I-D CRISPR-associated protein Cas10d/Csc3 n=1 Tax=Natrarchaeobius halalkaliphilus TaxID=1679091 RepID=A0A3N6N4B1_9EURY|nr:type I-D CRISPR-associated protein Cas10d/Csc3 [Natrarchaeobius halalkaliphilus]RQG93012.1 type I-D CRISPR-associated protein Cas10d/Csc3 [Natrarchaeobius halalkaliphilus]
MSDSSDDEQSEIDDFSYVAEGEGDKSHINEKSQSGVASLPEEIIENPDEVFAPDETVSDEQAALNEVFMEYLSEIDGKLIEAGWLYLPNKSTEYGKVDQSMLNHTRNLVFFLHRLAAQAELAGLRPISPKELRHLIALAVIHDYHKLRDEDENRLERFNITIAELEPFVDELGLKAFSTAPSEANSALEMQDFRSCAVDHHATENAKSTNVTLRWEEYRPFIRLADGMASSTTPEEAVNERAQKQFRECFPGVDVKLAHHRIDHVSGIFTNLLNRAVNDHLSDEFGYSLLTIYQDGCVYLSPEDTSNLEKEEELSETIADRFGNTIKQSHSSYDNPDQLLLNFSTISQGLYSLNSPDFFYAGAQNMLQAVVRKGVNDGKEDGDPSEAALDSMQLLEESLDQTFAKTEQQYGLGRFVNTIKTSFVRPLLNNDATGDDLIRATVAVFDLPESLADQLNNLSDETVSSLTSGGKWEYSYAIAQGLLDCHGVGPKIRNDEDAIFSIIDAGLSDLAGDTNDWRQLIRDEHAGNLKREVQAFISENLRVGSGILLSSESTVDTFDEYVKKSRGKTCTLCRRGVAAGGNLGPMKSKKSLTTLQSGFSNREMIGVNEREKLLLCSACRIEFSLRETASQRRGPGRLFFHLVPDYFYTPFSWQLYSRTINRFTGENRVRIGRLAEAVFDTESSEEFASVMNELTQPEGKGRTMIESLSQDFDQNLQFGAQTVGYFKNSDNDTEFQFFGTFLALSISSYTGMRVYLSASPIPEIRSRDFQEFVKIGGGFSQATSFYGDSVPLSELQGRLRSAAALIKLGHALQGDSRTDSLFAKYLRVTRNELLPGSYLLKRAAQSSDEGPYIPALMRYAVTLDEQAGIKQYGSNMSETPHSRITQLANLAYDAIRPASGHGRKPHRVERVFRESVKAVSKTGEQLSRDDYVMLVSGRLQKRLVPSKVNAVYPVSAEDSNSGTPLQERIEDYSEFFVDEILYGIANGRPSQLKRLKNNLADGFFGATLRAESRFYEERDQTNESNDADTEME